MIENDRQLQIAKEQIQRFKDALEQSVERPGDADPRLVEVGRDAVQSQLSSLEEQVLAYEDWYSSDEQGWTMEDLKELMSNLRGGIPATCDFCGKLTPEQDMHPEESDMWICIKCIDADPDSYFGGKPEKPTP